MYIYIYIDAEIMSLTKGTTNVKKRRVEQSIEQKTEQGTVFYYWNDYLKWNYFMNRDAGED